MMLDDYGPTAFTLARRLLHSGRLWLEETALEIQGILLSLPSVSFFNNTAVSQRRRRETFDQLGILDRKTLLTLRSWLAIRWMCFWVTRRQRWWSSSACFHRQGATVTIMECKNVSNEGHSCMAVWMKSTPVGRMIIGR
jgi:hypothetical protein